MLSHFWSFVRGRDAICVLDQMYISPVSLLVEVSAAVPVLSSTGARAAGYAGQIAAVWGVGLHFTGPSPILLRTQYRFSSGHPSR